MTGEPTGRQAFRLPWMPLDAWYEGALVIGLPSRAERALVADRRRTGRVNGVSEHLHVTLLYLGHHPASVLFALQHQLSPLARFHANVRVAGVGVFRAHDEIVNVHLQLESDPELLDAHARAVELAEGLKGFTAPKYPFLPHISLFRRIRWPSYGSDEFDGWRGRTIHLSRPHIMADPLEPEPHPNRA